MRLRLENHPIVNYINSLQNTEIIINIQTNIHVIESLIFQKTQVSTLLESE